jgi:hypothetical protein
MKQKDVALIIVVVFISGLVSFFVSKMLFSAKTDQQQVEVVDAISTEFTLPSEKYFNDKSIDPTKQIQIGDNTNNNPFKN